MRVIELRRRLTQLLLKEQLAQHYCPETTGDYYGWRNLENNRTNGHPNGGPFR